MTSSFRNDADRISGFFVDMDDTLYPEWAWVESGYRAVAWGVNGVSPPEVFFERLKYEHAKYGRFRIFNRIAEADGLDDAWVRSAVTAYRENRPEILPYYPGALAALQRLRTLGPVAVVTDGALAMQQAKVAALALALHVDAIVYTAELGKPKPAPDAFQQAGAGLGIDPARAVIVGDDPLLDIKAANALGCRSIRVRTGRFPCIEACAGILPTRDCADFNEAVKALQDGLPHA